MLILVSLSILVFGCSAGPLTFVEDPLQRIQNEVEQLKKRNKENVVALKQTYDEKIRRPP